MSTEAKKSNNWVWWIFGLGVFLLICYFLWKYTKLPTLFGVGKTVYNEGGGLLTDYGDQINTDKVLSYGEESNNVARLQQAVNDIIDKYGYSYTKLSVDGDFGNMTLNAVKYISNNTLNSGTVTVNKVYNLPKLPVIGALNPGTTTTAPTAAPTVSAKENPFARYKAY